MKIGVSGASGHLGQKVLSFLAERGTGHSVVGISRTPAALTVLAEGREGDYDRPDSLAQAYQGLDRLLIIPSADLRPGVRGRQLKTAIDAAQQAGVAHVVLVSAAGTKEAAEPSIGAPYWDGEQHLIRTAQCWTILRMNYYAESMADEIKNSLGAGVLAGLGSERVAYVSRDDVAAAAAGILLGEGHAGAIYNATGSAVVTGEERAAIVSELTGDPVGFAVLTQEQLASGLAQAGLPEPVVNVVLDIKRNFVAGAFDIVTSDVERLAGRPATPLRDVLAAALQA
ncbi:SDR family oxidoreductase [Dickeya sp. ws52]|uniref:SDR family oxidoreductase n=1 Tax=Dickeya sp. ws52 TaxID=2576377 RepID=UPI00117C4D25|nr:SDR family oxidoreductase [Dickeya sp. ws52]TYL41152.1 SDR family oxidoreductase [Dickeya sp. ws52]